MRSIIKYSWLPLAILVLFLMILFTPKVAYYTLITGFCACIVYLLSHLGVWIVEIWNGH